MATRQQWGEQVRHDEYLRPGSLPWTARNGERVGRLAGKNQLDTIGEGKLQTLTDVVKKTRGLSQSQVHGQRSFREHLGVHAPKHLPWPADGLQE